MIKRIRMWTILTVFALAMVSSGCSRTMKLTYDKPSYGEPTKGPIHVTVKDERPPKKGGNEPLLVGQVRSGAGIPWGLWAREDREPTKVIRELISDCLNAAGYRVAERPGGVPILQAVLQEFWSDGYVHNRMTVTVPMALKDREGSQPVWNYTLHANKGVTMAWGPAEMNKGYQRMLEDAFGQLAEQFKAAEFQKAYQGISRR